jgi:hypothetical protein
MLNTVIDGLVDIFEEKGVINQEERQKKIKENLNVK